MEVGELAWQTVSEAVLRIHLDLDRDWTLGDLAEETGYTAQHLTSLFGSVVGEPPLRYIRSLRIERAAFALAEYSDRSVQDVAEEAGYGSLEAFTRAFKRATGRSPTEYRAQTPRSVEPRSDVRLADLVDGPEGLGPPPVLEEVPPQFGWMVRTQVDPASIAQAVFSLVAAAPPSRAFQLGGLSHPWGYVGGPRESELHCVRYMEAPRKPVPAPFQELRLPATWYFRFEYNGTMDGIAPACEWLAREWIPRSGLRPGFAPLLSKIEAMGSDPVRAHLFLPARGLGSNVRLPEEEPAAADEDSDVA